jgi:hypothetical protein
MGQRLRYSARCFSFLIAGSLLLASSVASASASSALAAQGAGHDAVASNGGSSPQVAGNVEVRVPPALVGASDGLANNLAIGKSYHVSVQIWLAGAQPRTRATVTVTGAQTQQCAARDLVAGRVVSMQCRVVPTYGAVDAGLSVAVAIDVHTSPEIVTRFAHHVLDSGAPRHANPNSA